MRNKLLVAFTALILTLSTLANDQAKSEDNFIGIDVRSKMEVYMKSAPGAVHIPVSSIDKDSVKDIAKDAPIKVFCEAGVRANQAKTKLEALGYKNVENIGSWREWNKTYAAKVKKTNKD